MGVKTEVVHGVSLIAADDMVLHHQRRTGSVFEPESIEAWREAAAEPGAVVVDGGSYTGLYAIMAAKLGAQVLAFEPNPIALARAMNNARLNDVRLQWDCRALSDRCGQTGFRVSRPLTSAAQVTGPGTDVDAVPLDSLQLNALAAIKLDLEGHEVQALAGAVDTITEFKPLVIVEVLTAAARAAVERILKPLGYECAPADERNLICRSQ